MTISKQKNKKHISLIVMIAGLFVLITGLTFFLIKILSKPGLRDAEFLVSVGAWGLGNEINCEETTNCSGNSGVIWDFTEIGKGTLTTNNHLNDYEFIWAIDDDKLKIETDWLYELNDEFTYKLDQSGKVLTLNPGENEIKFIPSKEKINNESETEEIRE